MRGARLPDHELIDLLVDLEAAPPEAGGRDRSLWQRHVIPALRDDLRLGEALCQVNADKAVGTPLMALAGRDDPIAPLWEVAEWADYSVTHFRLQTMPGDHFFVRERVVPELLREVALELRESLKGKYGGGSSGRQEDGTRLLPTADLTVDLSER